MPETLLGTRKIDGRNESLALREVVFIRGRHGDKHQHIKCYKI